MEFKAKFSRLTHLLRPRLLPSTPTFLTLPLHPLNKRQAICHRGCPDWTCRNRISVTIIMMTVDTVATFSLKRRLEGKAIDFVVVVISEESDSRRGGGACTRALLLLLLLLLLLVFAKGKGQGGRA